MEFKGIYAANITPFEPDGRSIRADELEHLFLHLKRACVAGMVCNGHAGEGELLSREERVEVLRLARRVLGPGYPIVAGVHALPTWELIEQVMDAKEAGANAVMLCAPPLFAWRADRHPDFGIAQIRAVAEAVGDMPIVLFQYSPNNPFYYRPEVLARICREIPQVNPVPRAYARGFGALPCGQVRNIHPRTYVRGVLWYGVNRMIARRSFFVGRPLGPRSKGPWARNS